ncbi:hypothetical protein SAMN06265375_1011556 [Muriicola jejuensis]|uniref:DUF4097 family beta strand repeat protein n=1 Tax=Muriicola jejuensis TaxID=504488 RepID=A0A6P0U7A0_9FLAO|nr:hypothetical protein [Muriicola jejuensis]NER08964.1 hypothetical protein [Muriicola jejuensis]SMP12603.1 hypothetical protein SAMN06265375_1011556 [Muriicola jejuensis]
MKTVLFKKLVFFLLALPLLAGAHGDPMKGKYTKEKTIKKEFSVSSNAILKVSNSYGNIAMASWDENRIVIEVSIKTNGNNESKVQEKLDEISVAFEADASMVSAKTTFEKDRGWNWGWGKNSNVSMQIDYTIKLPVKNSIHISNDYGNISLDRIDGYAKISCDYGRLQIGELRGRNNDLSFDYTSKSYFGYINSGQIRADYSGFTVEKAGDLVINADYTDAAIGQMGNLKYSNDYGSLEVSEVGNVQGNGDYVNVSLGMVHGNVDISADYGAIRIEELAPDAGNVNIRTDYTGIKIGYSSQYYFDFEISTDYAGVSGKDELEISVSREKDRERYYKGFHGSSNSGKLMTINSDYGNISLKKN